jgi:hypothetical protein
MFEYIFDVVTCMHTCSLRLRFKAQIMPVPHVFDVHACMKQMTHFCEINLINKAYEIQVFSPSTVRVTVRVTGYLF